MGFRTYCCEEGIKKFWRIRYEVFVVLVDGINSENRVLSHKRMTVFLVSDELCGSAYKTRSNCRNKRLEKFGLADLLQESQSSASDIFVGMLLVMSAWREPILLGHFEWHCYSQSNSMRQTYQTRIISCFNFPVSSNLGHILKSDASRTL